MGDNPLNTLTMAYMENENDVTLDTSNETEVAPVVATEDVEALKEQNKKLFARAKTAEGFVLRDGHWVKKEKPAEQTVINNNASTAPSAMDILRDDAFKLYREGYDEKEIDAIMKNGGRKILEDKDNPVTLGILARKEQRGAEDAGSRINSNSQMSEVERKYTPEQLQNMTAAELSKILPHAD
jgi:hypothetical protein